jgi:NADPH:quinone reductase-like Zn-dependent oxidoreductase
MKAMVREKYGQPDVLHPDEVEKPKPDEGRVLVRVSAASLNKSDWYELTAPSIFRLMMGGIRKPKNRILGGDIAGRVDEIGSGVTNLKVGDEVFGVGRAGLAEWVTAKEVNLVRKPGNVGFDEAAAVPVAGITALQGLRKGGIKQGQKVLIYGSAGGVGTFAVQIAKSFGAEVTAVCGPNHLDGAKSIGADHVVDYTREDTLKSSQKYDLILAVNGYRSIFAFRGALTPDGVYVFVGSSKIWRALITNTIFGPLISRLGNRRMGFMGIAKIKQEDLQYLAGLLESGKVKPLVDKRYSLAEAPEAFRQIGEGHAGGKVVVRVSD